LYNIIGLYRKFGVKYCLHLQGRSSFVCGCRYRRFRGTCYLDRKDQNFYPDDRGGLFHRNFVPVAIVHSLVTNKTSLNTPVTMNTINLKLLYCSDVSMALQSFCWTLAAISPGREAYHSPPTRAEVKKMWIYTSTPPYAFMA
jgi:hypothetical protein